MVTQSFGVHSRKVLGRVVVSPRKDTGLPVINLEIMGNILFIFPAIELIMYHHEYWNIYSEL